MTEAVLRECVVNMARIKEAIALSVEKPNEAQAIDQIPQLLSGIAAGLLIGTISSLYPIFRAARLDPAESVRYV